MNRTKLAACTALLPVLALVAGCDEDPFQFRWTLTPQEAVIYSLDRQELGRPSAFNMVEDSRVVVEDPDAEGRWDFALDRVDGELVLLPPRVLGVFSAAAIVPVPGVEYEDVTEAPADTGSYVTDEPVPLDAGTIYIVRSHEQPNAFGQVCHYYGRLEPVELDTEAGAFTFRHDTSPDCNNRRLIPGPGG